MPIVAVTGDTATTTAVALAAAWPVADDVLVVEADPTGGDLAAWFDLPVEPSLSTVVTRMLDGAWPEVERHARRADNGIRVLPAPAGAAEAAQAVGESARSLVPTLAGLRSPVTIADVGRMVPAPNAHPFVAASAVTIVVHRQATQSARAAAVRLQRLVEQLDSFLATRVVVAVVGGTPYSADDVESFVHDAIGPTPVVGLPVDHLTAAVFGGRTGVSERRQARLPLSRSARDLAAIAHPMVDARAERVEGITR
jgi:MinD-like ATPase involved in chromosome partitioning or flagellar assembly